MTKQLDKSEIDELRQRLRHFPPLTMDGCGALQDVDDTTLFRNRRQQDRDAREERLRDALLAGGADEGGLGPVPENRLADEMKHELGTYQVRAPEHMEFRRAETDAVPEIPAIAAFPFSMEGVIFAKRTSSSTKGVKPFLASMYGRTSGAAISPDVSSTDAMGTNDTGVRSCRPRSTGSRGLISQISPRRTRRQVDGRGITSCRPSRAGDPDPR